MPEWVVVLDVDDPVSQKQLDICKQQKPDLKGVVECDKESKEPLCHSVDYFPAFCEAESNRCVYGLRQQFEEFS